MARILVIASWFAFVAIAGAQQNSAAEAARTWRERHETAMLSEFMQLLAIPNLASDAGNIRQNAAAISALLEKRGVKTQLLTVAGAPPVVFGRIDTPDATQTIVFYAHYDGQPLDPKEWATPPWQPVMRDREIEKDGRVIPLPVSGRINPEWRIYARSASDDKAPVVVLCAALDALRAAGILPHSNIRFVFEGEEEAASPHFAQIIDKYRDLLRSDVWLICDGPVHQNGRRQVLFGVRGFAALDITVYGPNQELHSGHYGNWSPNPAMMLARLLASMKDDDGRVTIDHFYDDITPLSETEKRALAEALDVDRDLMREFSLGRTDGAGKKLPSCSTCRH